MRIFTALRDWIEGAFKLAGAVLFTTTIAAVSLEIVMRYLFNQLTFWAEPIARNAMFWKVILGLAVGVRQKEDICVDFIADHMTGTLRLVVAWMRIALLLGFSGVFLFHGSQMARMNMRQTITGLDIPAGPVQLVVPTATVGMVKFAVELIAKRDWSRFRWSTGFSSASSL